MSFQVKHLATWSPGGAVVTHHWEVLIPLRLHAHFCLDGIHLYSPLLSSTIYPALNFFFCPTLMGSRMKQVALSDAKENESKKSTPNRGRNEDARATVCWARSWQLPWQVISKPLIESVPLFPHLLSTCHHTSSNLGEILWNWEASRKYCAHGCQTVISYFSVRTSDGDKSSPKLICYHMLWAAFSKSLQKLAFIIFVGLSFSTYRNMCTHQNRLQLNLNYLLKGYPRFLLFLPFPVAHF